MLTDTQFTTDWLEERYRFDVAARNPSVEAACLQHFTQASPINIIDIGAGTGANFVYLAEKFPQHQRWALVDLNPTLLKRARERLKNWAMAKGYGLREKKKTLLMRQNDQHIEVEFLSGSFLELPRLLPLHNYHLVTASAVFDLLSKPMLKHLVQVFHDHRLALLTTLNYESMSYLPKAPEDEHWIGVYEAHMKREQGFGQALGPDCGSFLKECYAPLPKAQLLSAPSRWQIEPNDIHLHRHLLAFLEESLQEMVSAGYSGKGLRQWLNEKQQLLEEQQLRLTVNHSDLFTAPVYEG